jgi:hypothetical protein
MSLPQNKSKESITESLYHKTPITKNVYEERFYALTKLIRISKMISNAKIISSPKMPKE